MICYLKSNSLERNCMNDKKWILYNTAMGQMKCTKGWSSFREGVYIMEWKRNFDLLL